jgi:uncharacterized protein
MLFEITVPQFIRTLNNLLTFIEKAEGHAKAKNFDTQILMSSRLAPDMFPFIKQVQIACDTAKLCASRLSGKEAPVNDDSEKTVDEIKERIRQTVKYLETFSAEDFGGAEMKTISQPRWEGKYLTGKEYVIHHAIPNIYFHVTTAYAILRHNGVDIGKKDYLGELPFKK